MAPVRLEALTSSSCRLRVTIWCTMVDSFSAGTPSAFTRECIWAT